MLRLHVTHRLAWLDRPTGQLVRRYERTRPGELVHVDVRKLGAIRPGGGWWVHGQGSAAQHHARTENSAGRRVGYDYVHCAIDDDTRLAYAEIHPDETAVTCAFLRGSRRLVRRARHRSNRAALPDWLHTYNHHRSHTALGGHPRSAGWSSATLLDTTPSGPLGTGRH